MSKFVLVEIDARWHIRHDAQHIESCAVHADDVARGFFGRNSAVVGPSPEAVVTGY